MSDRETQLENAILGLLGVPPADPGHVNTIAQRRGAALLLRKDSPAIRHSGDRMRIQAAKDGMIAIDHWKPA